MTAPYLGPLPDHGRFAYRPITRRPRLPLARRRRARRLHRLQRRALRLRRRARRGASGPPSPQPDVLNYSWREYGNRVGAWRCLELFDQLGLPTGGADQHRALRPLPRAGRGAASRAATSWSATATPTPNGRACSTKPPNARCCCAAASASREHSGVAPRGWLSPWISESRSTPDLLAETGYRYTLNWCHDDQPVPHAHAQRRSACGRCPIRRSSTTSR